MYPTASILRRVALTAALAAISLPAGAHAASPTSTEAHASASVALQARAQLSTSAAQRLATTSSGRARRALKRSQARLRRAADLAVVVAVAGDAQQAGAINAKFAATVSSDIDVLVDIVERAGGKLESAAARAIREEIRLEAHVSAAVATRADTGSDGAVASSMVEADWDNVATIGRLGAVMDLREVGVGARDSIRRAVGAALMVRAAIAARLERLRNELDTAGRQSLTAAVDAFARGSAAVSGVMITVLSNSASAHGTVDVGLPGAGIVAQVLVRLDGTQRARTRVHNR